MLKGIMMGQRNVIKVFADSTLSGACSKQYTSENMYHNICFKLGSKKRMNIR